MWHSIIFPITLNLARNDKVNNLENLLHDLCQNQASEFTQEFDKLIPTIINTVHSQHISEDYTLIKTEYLIPISDALLSLCHTSRNSEVYENALKHVTFVLNTKKQQRLE